MPSVLRQIAITKTEPGDENNQDISSLVGKIDIRKLEHFAQNDPDAYSYSGGLCLANQGLLEFVEMFKAPIKMLHPLLTATQEGNFKGTEGFSAIPFNGAHRRAQQRVGVAQLPQQPQQRGVPRPHLHRQGAVLRARVGRGEDLREAPHQLVAVQGAVRAGHARHDGAVLRAVATEGARELEHVLQDARVRRRDAEGRRPQGQDAAGVPRLRGPGRGHERPVDALRVQGAVGRVQPRPDGDRGQPGAPHVRARAAPRARGPARRGAPALPRASQGLPRAALRGVHRQGNPDGVPRVVRGVRAEHLRPLRHVRRLLDPGRGLPRSGDRARASTATRSTPSSRRSRSPSASPIRRTSATRS